MEYVFNIHIRTEYIFNVCGIYIQYSYSIYMEYLFNIHIQYILYIHIQCIRNIYSILYIFNIQKYKHICALCVYLIKETQGRVA